MTIDLSTMLASWREGKLRQRPPKGLLGKLEDSFKNKQARLMEIGRPTTPREIGEMNEARREFRSDWNRMRTEVLEGMDADITQAQATANPPAADAMLSRMGLLSNVHLPSWNRTGGNMVRDAERFAKEGDEAGLRLVREHIGLLKPGGPRQAVLEGVGEAQEALKTEPQRKAELEVRSLEKERDRFELGTGLHENFVRATTEPLRSMPQAPSPMAPAPAR